MQAQVEAFIARWQGQEGGQERANYALFLTELTICWVCPIPIRLPPPRKPTITSSSAW
ncbi:hypothetical protein [Rhizobium halophilum]|uniref:hypothetical protein n=1 Tax=Rhizobium halophilum TaxID=2846852 RepID=UPI00293F32CB|nr:hypothetical protein [Rhizobium halophilum]